ncbi:MAG: hypothetical protein ACOZBL_01140 [Patescibacteria group bacterium]
MIEGLRTGISTFQLAGQAIHLFSVTNFRAFSFLTSSFALLQTGSVNTSTDFNIQSGLIINVALSAFQLS